MGLREKERQEGPRRGGDVGRGSWRVDGGRGWWRVGGPGQKARAPMREARGWRERLSGRSGSAVSWRRGGMRRPQRGRGCKQRTRREVAGLRQRRRWCCSGVVVGRNFHAWRGGMVMGRRRGAGLVMVVAVRDDDGGIAYRRGRSVGGRVGEQ